MRNSNKTNSSKIIFSIITLILITIVTLFLFSNSKLPASQSAFEKAKIIFEEESHDFGTVAQGPQLEYSFKFANEGEEPLVIGKVQPSCGCTGAATDGKTEYAKGESGEIKITFNTQGRERHVEKSIAVTTNDTLNPQINLKFKCDIVK